MITSKSNLLIILFYCGHLPIHAMNHQGASPKLTHLRKRALPKKISELERLRDQASTELLQTLKIEKKGNRKNCGALLLSYGGALTSGVMGTTLLIRTLLEPTLPHAALSLCAFATCRYLGLYAVRTIGPAYKKFERIKSIEQILDYRNVNHK